MLGKIIYKRDTGGAIRQWNWEVEGEKWRSHSGIHGGTITPSGWTSCVPRSKDTPHEQALFEAEAEMGKKLDRDYALTLDAVDEIRAFGGNVMLAKEYKGQLPGGVNFSQPKLDGMRCKANRFGLWSRTGKPILSCPHIFAVLGPAFANTPDLELDGELYNHDLKDNFNKLMSILRKAKPTDEDIAEAASVVQYHLYDIWRPAKNFGDRFRTLELFVESLGAPEIVLVPTVEVRTSAEVDTAYGSYLEAGYEGQILRLDAEYERKRSKNLLKRKEFETAEFELVAIEEGNGNWAGLAKRVRFKLPDGRECGGGIRGSAEEAKTLLERAPSLVGRPVTIRFFTPTPDGMPRFPVAIDFDRPDA